ncbi:MAG: 1-phosphofructokinase [Bombilactobacillus mellifer]|nr:1-phosphofructokinase [Bombilactobacillus mellifer]
MIYTLTLNPAIDLFIETEHLKKDIVNRTKSYDVQANGKGVNVSLILKALGIDNIAMGIGAGFTLRYIVDYLNDHDIATDFLYTPGITRINVFTRVLEGNNEYKLVNPGPYVNTITIDKLMKKIKNIKASDFLIISGSFAQGISPIILNKIAQSACINGFNLVVDTSYSEVMQILKHHPFLIKPDEEEIMSWFNLSDKPDLMGFCDLCLELIKRGAQRVLLSLGSKGALYVDPDKVLFGNAAKGKVINTACSGDTMLGTFIAGIIKGQKISFNLQNSIAAGSSTAFRAGLTDFSDIAELKKQIEIEKLGGN